MTISNLDAALLKRFKNIKLLVLDVDGVMTDGGLTLGDDGQEYKTFHTHDGLGMKLLKASGVDLAIITGRTSNVVKKRAESTGVAHFYQGAEDKLEAFNDLISTCGLKAEQCAFMGDDVVDLPPMLVSGLAIAVPRKDALAVRLHQRGHIKGATRSQQARRGVILPPGHADRRKVSSSIKPRQTARGVFHEAVGVGMGRAGTCQISTL